MLCSREEGYPRSSPLLPTASDERLGPEAWEQGPNRILVSCSSSHRTLPETKSTAATEGLAKVGVRAALSFAFAFLKRAWRSGEDSDLCTEVLQEAYEILHGLPVALLFDSTSVSSVWLDVVDRSMLFLSEVCRG